MRCAHTHTARVRQQQRLKHIGCTEPCAGTCRQAWHQHLVHSSQLTAKGGATGSNFGADFFPIIGDGRLPQRPYIGTRRHVPTTAQAHVNRAPANATVCDTHSLPACITCKRLRKTAQECCSLGHHEAGHVPRRPQLQLCEAHRLPPCPICARTQRGVRHCCARGHHKVCTPVQPSRKRCSSQQPKRSYKAHELGLHRHVKPL